MWCFSNLLFQDFDQTVAAVTHLLSSASTLMRFLENVSLLVEKSKHLFCFYTKYVSLAVVWQRAIFAHAFLKLEWSESPIPLAQTGLQESPLWDNNNKNPLISRDSSWTYGAGDAAHKIHRYSSAVPSNFKA